MAKKEETISLIDTFSEFKELKNIDRTTMVSVLEESFRSVIAKMFGTDENYDVIVNPDKGDFEIWRNREVVADEDLENPNLQISLRICQDFRLKKSHRWYRLAVQESVCMLYLLNRLFRQHSSQ